jgi:hypothetical protein
MIDGTRVYVTGEGKVHVVDISDPTNPTLLLERTWPPQGFLPSVVAWPYGFVSAPYRLQMFDLREQEPTIVAEYESDQRIRLVEASPGRVLLLDTDGKVTLLTASLEDGLAVRGTFAIDDRPVALTTDERYAYLSVGESSSTSRSRRGLVVWDLSDPSRPHEVAFYPTDLVPRAPLRSGRWVVVPTAGAVYYLLAGSFADSDPSRLLMTPIARLAVPLIGPVAVDGDLLLIGSFYYGLTLYRLPAPSWPGFPA